MSKFGRVYGCARSSNRVHTGHRESQPAISKGRTPLPPCLAYCPCRAASVVPTYTPTLLSAYLSPIVHLRPVVLHARSRRSVRWSGWRGFGPASRSEGSSSSRLPPRSGGGRTCWFFVTSSAWKGEQAVAPHETKQNLCHSLGGEVEGIGLYTSLLSRLFVPSAPCLYTAPALCIPSVLVVCCCFLLFILLPRHTASSDVLALSGVVVFVTIQQLPAKTEVELGKKHAKHTYR